MILQFPVCVMLYYACNNQKLQQSSCAFSHQPCYNEPHLTGNNFKKWKNDVEICLGCWDLELALREPEPPVIDHNSIRAEKDKAENWERDNRLGLKIIQKAMTEIVRGGIPEWREP